MAVHGLGVGGGSIRLCLILTAFHGPGFFPTLLVCLVSHFHKITFVHIVSYENTIP
jgi:hypothetical protein